MCTSDVERVGVPSQTGEKTKSVARAREVSGQLVVSSGQILGKIGLLGQNSTRGVLKPRNAVVSA